MNTNLGDLVPKDLSDSARVWIYQSNRAFTIREELQIKELLQNFTEEWESRCRPLKCYANLFFAQFIIFISGETPTASRGCNTDSLIRLIRSIGKDFRVELFDRLMLAFIINEIVELLPLSLTNSYIENGLITTDTLYFNNTLLTKKELLNNWIIPVKESWLAIRIHEKRYLKLS